jgi:peptide/nickel transport system permease protein
MRAPRSLVAGGGIVAGLGVIATLAPWIAPYSPRQQLDPAAATERPPGTVMAVVALADGRSLLADRVERTPSGLVVERRGQRRELAAREVLNLTAGGVADRRVFLLGTDRYGRDVLSRLLHGARISLAVALLAGGLALSLGLAVGSLAAMARPWLDAVLMRLVDALLAFPKLFLLLALAALFRPSNWLLVVALGGTAWMTLSRLVRAELKGLKEREFVTAARALGLPGWRILLVHLLPNALPPILAATALLVGGVVAAESALSFLGLGVQPPQASWGSILNDGSASLTSAWWVATFPGLAIALAVSGFNLLGDGLRDALDPRLDGR